MKFTLSDTRRVGYPGKMNDAGVAGNGGDALTRTTLHVAGASSAAQQAYVVRALQRVPGVLLVDMDPVTERAIVAHDGAVPLTALVTAAAGAGFLATIVRKGGPPAANASAPSPAKPDDRVRRFWRIVILAALGVAFVITDLVMPDTVQKRVLMTAVLAGAWICYFVLTFAR